MHRCLPAGAIGAVEHLPAILHRLHKRAIHRRVPALRIAHKHRVGAVERNRQQGGTLGLRVVVAGEAQAVRRGGPPDAAETAIQHAVGGVVQDRLIRRFQDCVRGHAIVPGAAHGGHDLVAQRPRPGRPRRAGAQHRMGGLVAGPGARLDIHQPFAIIIHPARPAIQPEAEQRFIGDQHRVIRVFGPVQPVVGVSVSDGVRRGGLGATGIKHVELICMVQHAAQPDHPRIPRANRPARQHRVVLIQREVQRDLSSRSLPQHQRRGRKQDQTDPDQHQDSVQTPRNHDHSSCGPGARLVPA